MAELSVMIHALLPFQNPPMTLQEPLSIIKDTYKDSDIYLFIFFKILLVLWRGHVRFHSS